MRLDLSADQHCRKNEKLFRKTLAQTVDQERGRFATLRELTPIKLGDSNK